MGNTMNISCMCCKKDSTLYYFTIIFHAGDEHWWALVGGDYSACAYPDMSTSRRTSSRTSFFVTTANRFVLHATFYRHKAKFYDAVSNT